MIYRIQYKTEMERDNIISANIDKYLIEEQNIIEGNFLVFTDIEPIEVTIAEIKQRQQATDGMVLQLLIEGMM